jgi:hypothetical protein
VPSHTPSTLSRAEFPIKLFNVLGNILHEHSAWHPGLGSRISGIIASPSDLVFDEILRASAVTYFTESLGKSVRNGVTLEASRSFVFCSGICKIGGVLFVHSLVDREAGGGGR